MNAFYSRDIFNINVIDTFVHIWQIQKLTFILLPKKKNTNILKTRDDSEKPMLFLDLATSKYSKTAKISLALEKKFFC